MTLIATYYSGDRRGTPADFEILVNGTTVANPVVDQSDPHTFYDVAYPIPEQLVQGMEEVTVRFQAKEGSQVATIFGLRMIRGSAPR
jgi:hypothetical protein